MKVEVDITEGVVKITYPNGDVITLSEEYINFDGLEHVFSYSIPISKLFEFFSTKTAQAFIEGKVVCGEKG